MLHLWSAIDPRDQTFVSLYTIYGNGSGYGLWVQWLIIFGLYLKKNWDYHKTFNTRHNKSQNLNDSHGILQLSLPNPLEPGVKLRMKM